MKVFEMNDIEWWAGPDHETTKEAYLINCDSDLEDIETMRELSDKEMEETEYFDETEKLSFKEHLKNLQAKGTTFPCFFASTEY